MTVRLAAESPGRDLHVTADSAYVNDELKQAERLRVLRRALKLLMHSARASGSGDRGDRLEQDRRGADDHDDGGVHNRDERS